MVFKKVTSAGLNSLRQKVYRISVKIRILDDLFHKRGTVLVILVLGMIQPPGPGSFWVKKAFEAVEAIEVPEAGEVKGAAEVTET